ncbi:MAG: hypothetical protein ACK5IQ_06355 [Bacteroidales bacterium]
MKNEIDKHMKLKFFHIPRPKRFSIGHRFYDEDKERAKEALRRNNIQLEDEDISYNPEAVKARMKGSFREAAKDGGKVSSSMRRAQNIRLLVLFVILVAIIWFFLNVDVFVGNVEGLWRLFSGS